MVYAHVDKFQSEAVLSAEHIYSAPAVSEIYHLLPCNFARRNTYSCKLNAMISAEQKVIRVP